MQLPMRKVLQLVGDGLRQVDERVWVRRALSRLAGAPAGSTVVFTDVRYPNEIAALRELEHAGEWRVLVVFLARPELARRSRRIRAAVHLARELVSRTCPTRARRPCGPRGGDPSRVSRPFSRRRGRRGSVAEQAGLFDALVCNAGASAPDFVADILDERLRTIGDDLSPSPRRQQPPELPPPPLPAHSPRDGGDLTTLRLAALACPVGVAARRGDAGPPTMTPPSRGLDQKMLHPINSRAMQRFILPLATLGTCLAETQPTSDSLVLDLQDPWTVAAIVILSLLALLLLARACMGVVSVSVEAEVTAPEEVVVELAGTDRSGAREEKV